MNAHAEFAPPATPGLLRALLLALVAHALLLAALTAGIRWNSDVVQETVQAELWSSVPQDAAPPPAPEPEPVPAPATDNATDTPAAPPPAPAALPAPPNPDAAIAIERLKARQLKEEQIARERAAQEKAAAQQAAQEKAARAQAAAEQAARDKAAQQKLLKDKIAKEKAAQDKNAQLKQDKADKEQARKQQLADARQNRELDELRQQNLKRIAGMAGSSGNGDPNSQSRAAQASGPSAGYAGRIVARIKPNIVFTDDVNGNPRVEVEIRTAPSGAILSARITEPSGVKSWDDAVVRAIVKTEVLPKDIDGSIPTSMQIGFRPKD